MKKILLAFVLLAVFLVGCQKIAEEAMEKKIESETGNDAEVDISKGKVSVKTDEGEMEIESSGFDNDNWCQEGAEWKMTASGMEGAGNAQWMIGGLMASGKFAGLCHVVYTAESPEGTTRMDYYFSEDGESGYFEMDVNGEKMVSEWHK